MMTGARYWHVITRVGRSASRSTVELILFFAFGIWIALGTCWTDMAVQESFGWSPLGGTQKPGEGWTIDESDTAINVSLRGTTPRFLDLQQDLALGLNTAFPFEALGMKPFFPREYTQALGLDGFDANHRWFAAGWLALPLSGLLVLAFKGKRRRIPLVAFAALTVICIGLLATLQWGGLAESTNRGQGDRIVSALFVALLWLSLSLCAIAVVFGGLLPNRAKAKQRGYGEGRTARFRICQAWFSGVLMTSLLGLFAKGALWLGWYTTDTRVNLLEPLAVGAALVALSLAFAMELAIRSQWHSRACRPWRRTANTTWLVVIATVLTAATIPDPPRLALVTEGGEYILMRGSELVPYGDRDASLREGFPRHLQGFFNFRKPETSDQGVSKEREPLAIGLFGFNSANSYSHLYGLPLLQLSLIVFVIGSIACVAVLGASTLSGLLNASIWAARAGPKVMLVTAWQVVILAMPFGLLGWQGISAIQSHAMDQVLMHARGDPILNFAFRSLMSYRVGNESSDYWRLPWKIVPMMYLQFDASFADLLRGEASVLREIGYYGAADSLYFSNDGELKDRIRRVGWVLRQRQSLFAVCETFPDTLRFQLERHGFPKRLVESAFVSWTRELSVFRGPNLIRIRRLSAEVDLLSALERIQDFWLVDRPGAPPIFGRREQLVDYLDKMTAIVDLKDSEVRHASELQSRLAWMDRGLNVNTDRELHLVATQREALSCLWRAIQRAESAGRRFDAPALALECDTAIRKVEVISLTEQKR